MARAPVISLTDCYRETDYGEPMVGAEELYYLSPFAEKSMWTRY